MTSPDNNLTDDKTSEEPLGDDLPTEGSSDEVTEELSEESAEAAELQRLTDENKFLLDQVQRSRAELENFRRRTAEEREASRRRVTMDVFRRVLPLYDDLQLAVRNKQASDKLLDGIRIIAAEFDRVLDDFKIETIAAVGEAFDPNWHEAIFQEETADHAEGEVLEEFERGYRLGESLIRPARVKVAKAPSDSA